jgi:pimeloyl-ACP methyl ester carboxylesterase
LSSLNRLDQNIKIGRGHAPPDFVCETASGAGDVVLLHGFFGAPWTMRAMGRVLRRDGFRDICPWYESWASPFDRIVERICKALETRHIGTERSVHFVGHSMGGLIARAVAARLDPPLMGHMVMIGTPNGGSELADFCMNQRVLRPALGRAGPALITGRILPLLDALEPPAYSVGVIAGNRAMPGPLRILPHPHDGRVSVASTHLAGESDHIVLPISHGMMPSNRAVQRQTLHFLTMGQFARDAGTRTCP